MVSSAGYANQKKFVIFGEGGLDKFALAENIDKLISSGAMTRNEVRLELGLEAVPGGDTFLITKNYQGENEIEKGESEDDNHSG